MRAGNGALDARSAHDFVGRCHRVFRPDAITDIGRSTEGQPAMSGSQASGVKKSEIFGWAMYDFANSSYTTVVISFVYSAFFTKTIVPASTTIRDSYWAIAIVLSTLLAIVLSPLIGAICDYSGGKKKYLLAATLTCAVSTAALALVAPGQVGFAIAFVAISNAAFMIGESFVASFLPDLATPKNMGIISGLGWGLGYMGGLGSLLLVYTYLGDLSSLPPALGVARHQHAMLLLSAFFLLSALPTFLLVRDRSQPRPGFERAGFRKLAKAGLDEVKSSFALMREYRVLFRFFLAFMVYMAGLEVVIKFIGIYIDAELAMTADYKKGLFLVLQVSAAAGALAFGFLEKKLGAKATVLSTILWWIMGIFAIYFLDVLAQSLETSRENVFLIIGIIAGAGIGSIQSSSRTVVGLLSPPERSAQMFGFWGMFLRAAIILGMTFGPMADALGSRRQALLLVVAFFAVGGALLWRIPIQAAVDANRR